MEFMQTQRGQRALIYGGRSFRLKEKYKNGNKRWFCRSRQCTGSLITSADEKVIYKDQGHSCAPDYAKIAVEKMKEEGLRRCREELTPISMIHKEIFSPALDQGLDLLVKVPNLSSIKSSMYRNRSKALEDSCCDGDNGCITFDTTEDTETKTDDSSTTTPAECVQTVLEEKKELSLEERYFPSPPTVSFEGLDSALPDESVRFDDLTEDVSDASDTDTAGKTGDSSPDEDLEFSDDDKKADNELVSLGYGVEVKAKFLNKCLIYGKTAKKLTRCLVDVIFPDTKLLANCSALGNKSNLTKLTRAALPSRKVACIIDYVKKRFPDANKSEIVLVMNLKCKEARAIIGKSGPDGKNPVVRRLLAKEQELESSAVSSHPQKMQSAGVPKIKLPPPPKVQKLTTVNKTSPTTTVTTTAPVTVLRQPPNIVCVQKNPSNAALSPLLQQKGIRTGLVQLRLPMNTAPTSTLAHRPPAILGKPTTVLKVPPRTRPETIRTILTRAQPQVGKMGGNKILLPLHFIHQKAGSALGKPSETTDAATGSQRQCIIVGARTAEATSSTPQTAATNSQNPCTSTVKQE